VAAEVRPGSGTRAVARQAQAAVEPGTERPEAGPGRYARAVAAEEEEVEAPVPVIQA
jgi:hypothetical protein